MPSFGIGTNDIKRDSGEAKGRTYNIACKVWFPTNKYPYPLSFKFEGDDGVLVTVSELIIKHTEEKIYYGGKSLEYRCDVIMSGIRKDIKIIYYVMNCKWVMVV